MTMQLTRENLKKIKAQAGIEVPDDKLFELPEKVLQFGTGILLRGLPDYFIDKANRQGIFNGRIVIVKSTSTGGTADFDEQDGLYTLCVRGFRNWKIQEGMSNQGMMSEVRQSEVTPNLLPTSNC